MKRIVLTPKDPILAFDYQSVLFRQFVKNSIVGVEAGAGEEIELTILGGTAVFLVNAVEPPDATSITEQTEVAIEVQPAVMLGKQMGELKISDKEEVFVGFEDQVKALRSVLELRMG